MASNTFFAKFPLISYDIDGTGTKLTLTNIVKNVDVNDNFANHSSYYTYYNIVDGERPDTVSYKLYENTNHYWTFFVLNNDLRTGLNNAWPLSNLALEKMIEQEYDDYSAVTLMPHSLSNNGIGTSGVPTLMILNAAYLPYLRLANPGGDKIATILKYDHPLNQIVYSNVEYNDGSGPVLDSTSFKESVYFNLKWKNPFTVDTDEYKACEELRQEFVSKTISVYSEFDASAVVDPSTFSELPTQEDIDAAILSVNSAYVFSKRFVGANTNFRWASYRNAASEYYVEIDGVKRSVSVYDLLTDPNVIVPSYISNYEKEERLNSQKERIKVIRKDRVNDFVTAYFQTLNS